MTRVDLVVTGASQVLTMRGPDGETSGPRRGDALAHTGAIENGALAIDGGKVEAVGPAEEVLSSYEPAATVDLSGQLLLPGFVDTHTHLIWAGSRAWELDWKVRGRSYQEITKAGGGIPYTVRETRQATRERLVAGGLERAAQALHHGTTTLEAKTGYGLSHEAELEQAAAIASVDASAAQEVVGTFLGAHERPLESKDNPEATQRYLTELTERTLPALQEQGHARFVDAFVEDGVYAPDEVRPMLERAKALGFGLRLHVDEFSDLGGAAFAVEMGARSADHLLSVSPEGVEALAASDTVATLLPLVPFALRAFDYAPARAMVDAGCIVSLASDFNPNVPCIDMLAVVRHAVYGMGLTPSEALVAATANAGYSIDPEGGLGVLAPGHPANFVAFDVPGPTELVYAFASEPSRQVFVAGERVA